MSKFLPGAMAFFFACVLVLGTACFDQISEIPDLVYKDFYLLVIAYALGVFSCVGVIVLYWIITNSK